MVEDSKVERVNFCHCPRHNQEQDMLTLLCQQKEGRKQVIIDILKRYSRQYAGTNALGVLWRLWLKDFKT